MIKSLDIEIGRKEKEIITDEVKRIVTQLH